MAQPRLQLALAHDGLLPEIFGRVSASGNLRMGTAIAGALMTVIATCVPFGYLDDIISAGILVAFSMTNASLIVMRCESPAHRPHLLRTSLIVYSFLCFMTGMLLSHTDSFLGSALSVPLGIATATTACFIAWACPRSKFFGGHVLAETHPELNNDAHFEAPWVPLLPCLGMFVNFKLISELDVSGILLLLVYLAVSAGLYLALGAKRNVGWGNYEGLSVTDPDATKSGLIRSISLTRVSMSDSTSRTPMDRHGEHESCLPPPPPPPSSDRVLRPQHTI